MYINQESDFGKGYTPIAEIGGKHGDMLLDFGILVLDPGDSIADSSTDREKAYMLLDGEVEYGFDGKAVLASRSSLLDEGPWTLHAAAGAALEITAVKRSELVVQKVDSRLSFETQAYSPDDTRSQRFGEGTMQETSTRTVRTVFDAATNKNSGMVLGEVINHPGKWSSYPPHDHAHPEIYHFRFFPEQGFGFSQIGDQVHRVTNRDTVAIPGGVVHPQTAAPGYAMYYVWSIPHLPGNRFGPDSRVYREEHSWLMQTDATIWPDSEK